MPNGSSMAKESMPNVCMPNYIMPKRSKTTGSMPKGSMPKYRGAEILLWNQFQVEVVNFSLEK